MGRVDVPVVVTEGAKALAIVQNGFPAIGLNGVYGACARDADDKIILHPLLASFAWLKRSVYLVFDADITTKFERRKALLRTFLLLVAQQAEVFTITSWDGSEAKGIDDFLAKSENPAADLELLIKDRTPFVETLEKTPADLRLVEENSRLLSCHDCSGARLSVRLLERLAYLARNCSTPLHQPPKRPHMTWS